MRRLDVVPRADGSLLSLGTDRLSSFKRIARVFPSRTNATPDDALAFDGPPDLYTHMLGIDEVHVSCVFTYDKPRAEQLAKAWETIAPVKLGGVAYDGPGDTFVPGRYIKPGYTFTSQSRPS